MALSTIFVYFVYARRCFRCGGGAPAGGSDRSAVAGGTHVGASEVPARRGDEMGSLDDGVGLVKSESGTGEGNVEHVLGGGEGGGASTISSTTER